MTENTELETLFPQPEEIEVGGKKLSILPIKVGKLPALIRAVAPFFEIFKQGKKVNFIALLADHGESVLDACAIGAGVDRAFIDDLDPAELVKIAQAVVEVNMDFFILQLVPSVTAATAKMVAQTGDVSAPA